MKRTAIILAALLPGQILCAQNLNPQVQVTNEYQTRLNDVSKQGPAMAVPDSLYQFDYHFDYSVLDSPYKGAYEFSPYSVHIKPDPSVYDGRKLYVRAGAGYVFRPEFDIVWAAVDQKKIALNVFASSNGFAGKYRYIVPNTFELNKKTNHDGFDFDANAGIDVRLKLGKLNLRSEFGLDGIYTRHELYHRSNANSPYADVRFGITPNKVWAVSGGVKYRFVYDWLNGRTPLTGHEVTGDVVTSIRPATEYRIIAEFLFAANNYYWGIGMHPHLLYQLGMLDVDAGMRFGWVADHFTVSPDIKATVHLLNDYLQIYAGAAGKDHYTAYWDYKTQIHHYFAPNYVDPRPIREVADIYLGVNGHADFGLQYDVRGGYRFLKDAPLWAAGPKGLESLYFLDCDILHADLALNWSSERLNLDGGLHLAKIPQGVPVRVFEPSLVTATFKATYNWMKRIYAGVSLDAASDRQALIDGYTRSIPGYADLGIHGEYRFNNRLGLWLKGSNLLNHDVRLSPLYVVYGPSLVVGVTFTL